MSDFDKQLEKVSTQEGFLAALDQSGGSSPKALRLYGFSDDAYKDDESMFDIIHEMRSRIITSPAFHGDRVLGAILFVNTMDRKIQDMPTARYLWKEKDIVPFLKIDKGLDSEKNGVQLMKASIINDLDILLKRSKDEHGIFGTKMRSVINLANEEGIKSVVEQQFETAKRVCAAGLIPIIEPEVNINCPQKKDAEMILRTYLLSNLNHLEPNENVILKLTIPDVDNLYKDCIDHPNVIRVVALSGGYTQQQAIERLAKQNGMIASFSRALTDGLTHQMSDEEFNSNLDKAIGSIFEASKS